MRRLVLIPFLALLAHPGLASAATAGAGPIRFARMSVKQGLSQSTVLCTFQDSRGFVWFCTEDGLNRHDGYSVTVYRHDPTDAGSLPNNFVRDVDEDAEGNLWVATEGGGIAKWVAATDRFQSYRHQPDSRDSLASDRVRTLRVDGKGQVWVGTRGQGLDRLDPRTGKITHHRSDPADGGSLSDDNVTALLEDHAGVLWIGTNGGLDRLDAATGRFRRYRADASDPSGLADDQVRSLAEDKSGTLWVGTQAGGLHRMLANGKFQRLRSNPADPRSLSSDFVRAMITDSEGRLWLATPAGLNLLDNRRGGFERYVNDPADPESLSDDDLMSVYQDRGGVIWVGTRSGGVNRWNPRTWSFGYHRAQPAKADGLTHNYVTAFAVGPQNRLWVGTLGGGLNVLDRRTGEWSHYRYDARKPGGLSDDRVMALRFDHGGNLWVGTMAGGLSRMDVSTGAFRTFRNDPRRADSLSSNAVTSIFEDSRGTVWVGTYQGGLNRFDARTGTFTHYRHDAADPRSLSGDIVTTLAEGPAGVLWVGTNGGGLTRLVPDTGESLRLRHDPADTETLASDTVYALHVDSSGTVWAGTRGGLSVLKSFDAASGRARFRNYSERAGLPNSVVYAVLPDNSGRLWLSTNNGLAVFNPERQAFRTYQETHGLQGNEFNVGAHYRSAGGELFFGGPSGFNAFIPEQVEVNEHAPAVALTGYWRLNRPVTSEGPLHQLQSLQLGHRDQVVTFEFAALDYAAPESNRYQYKLEGFDEGWVDQGPVRRVTYTNLDSGRYVLRVKAANGDGVWSEKELDLGIRVLPPPWKTWWAYLGYALLALAGVLAFADSLRRKAAREAGYRQRLETDVEARTRELQESNQELATVNQRLLETSLTDSLTGLRNRRFLFEEASKDLALVERRRLAHDPESRVEGDNPRGNVVFIMVDLDWFKPINDTCGHAAGDRVLLQVRDVLEKACRRSDVLIRWGGDEFLVIGRDHDLQGLEVLPERIRSLVEQTTFELGDGRVAHLTCSVGFTCYPTLTHENLLSLSLEHVIGLADSALYMAKKSGRNAWVGLLATEVTSAEDVLESIHRDAQQVAERGRMEILSSRAEPQPDGVARPEPSKERPRQQVAPGSLGPA
jgi:diguanylate cyclase (GGDEF)-like protein